jgi:Spy/CpxP family protein refolding chaperone
MNRFPRILAVGLLALAAAAPAMMADGASDHGRGHGLGGFRRCLHSLDLNADQETAIQSLVSAARPGLRADMQTLRGDRQKLEADIAAGADASTLGQDVLTRHADGNKLKSDLEALKNQILGKLTTDQQNTVQSCLQSSAAARQSRGAGGVR